MRFEHPFIFALSIPFLLSAILMLYRRRPSTPHALLVGALRGLVVLSIIIALAGPLRVRDGAPQGITALLDVSASVTKPQGEALLERARALANELGSPLSLVTFSSEVARTATITSSSFTSIQSASTELGPHNTHIEGALRSSLITPHSPILLLSDGYETKGHALKTLQAQTTAPIFPLTAQGPPETAAVSISQLLAPNVVKNQKSAEIRATISNVLGERVQGALSLRHGPTELLKKTVVIDAARDITVTSQSDPHLEGLQPITATFSWNGKDGAHSITRTTWMSGEKRDRILLLSGSPDDDRFLSQIWKGQAYQVQSEIAGSSGASLGGPKDYMAVILNNVPVASIPKQFEAELPAYVRQGGGLIMVGGNKSFGLGGYIGSAVEEILPVRLVPPHVEKKRLNVAVQLVIDKSRSMAMEDRLEFAKAASREVLGSLKDDDYIGVIGFDDSPFVALPLSLVGNVRSSAADRISRLFPTKKTNLFPALDEARRGLSRIQAGRKHVIVLTDGKLPDPGPYYFDLVKQMRILGITASTVVVGNDADDGFLAQLANVGGGSFYQTRDPQNLPKIFLSDVKVASDEQTLKENPTIEVSIGPDGISSTQMRSFPFIKGFVETLPRDPANTELVVSEDGKMFPLLASWPVEKGRVVAFTSDSNGRWTAPWIRWESINEFWSDLVESVIPKAGKARSNVDFELRSWVDGADNVIDLSLFQDVGDAPISAAVTTPNGTTIPLSFSKLSSGHYQARVSQPAPGTYKANISLLEASLPEVAWEVSADSVGERPHPTPNRELLEKIASLTGGKVDPLASDLMVLKEKGAQGESLAHLFSILALALFFTEVLTREFGSRLRRRRPA
jgi:uncharacterized membrane protein